MKYAFAALALAALARAQSRDDIPECALPCLDKAIKDNSDCSVEDTACVCGAFDAIRGDASTCVIDACGIDTALSTLPRHLSHHMKPQLTTSRRGPPRHRGSLQERRRAARQLLRRRGDL
jgi:hypothetical protein